MSDDDEITEIERRLDKIEIWQATKDAVEKDRSDANIKHHTNLQFMLSMISSITMVINLYLAIYHRK